MELTTEDRVENVIEALLVVPRNNRLYDYYINAQEDRRTMLQRNMLQFCIDLCPDHASEIRRCIYEIHTFVIFPLEKGFIELKEDAPPKINKRVTLFPMGKKVKEDKINLIKENEGTLNKIKSNFSIWGRYNVHLEAKIRNNKK